MPKKIPPLTDSKIKTAKAKEKQYSLNDGDGLRFIVTIKDTKYFRFDYTRPNGKRNSISMGKYPTITLAEAREKRLEYRKLLSNGIDPSGYKEITEDSDEKLFKYIAEAYLKKTENGIAATTFSNYVRYVKYMVQAFGDKEIDTITISDISKMLLQFDHEGKVETAKRILRLLKTIYKYAMSTGYASHNTAYDVDAAALLSKQEKKHYDHIDNEQEFAQLLLDIDDYFGDPITKLGLKYTSMTFLRPENVRGLQWERIDFDKKLITYLPEEMKNGLKHVVPLTDQLIDVLNEAAQLSKDRSIYVFPSPQSNTRILSENTLNVALKRMGYRGRMTSHGFRHTASTLLHDNLHIHKVASDAIELQMAHKDGSIRGVYNHAQYLPERTRLMEWWCDYMDEIKVNYRK
jgi:integrase